MLYSSSRHKSFPHFKLASKNLMLERTTPASANTNPSLATHSTLSHLTDLRPHGSFSDPLILPLLLRQQTWILPKGSGPRILNC